MVTYVLFSPTPVVTRQDFGKMFSFESLPTQVENSIIDWMYENFTNRVQIGEYLKALAACYMCNHRWEDQLLNYEEFETYYTKHPPVVRTKEAVLDIMQKCLCAKYDILVVGCICILKYDSEILGEWGKILNTLVSSSIRVPHIEYRTV